MDNCEVLLRMVQKEARRPFLVAIDGRCASGKTTLAGNLRSALECNVVHMDDFYLPFSKRTEERMAQPGGNMDFDRLLFEVLRPLKSGTNASYRPYDCHEDRFLHHSYFSRYSRGLLPAYVLNTREKWLGEEKPRYEPIAVRDLSE